MRKLLLILLLFPILSYSQNKGLFGFYDTQDRNQFISICGLQLISGAARGYEQVVTYHYSYFKEKYPNANDEFFNPQISWLNKYKNHNPQDGEAYFLSTSALVFTTDFKHLMDITSDVPNYVCITLPLFINHGKVNWKQILFRVITIVGCREVGFNTIYSVIYKK